MKTKILLVFGTRPEAIKMAPLVLEFKKFPNFFEICVCVTGQHRQMLDQILDLFGIIPDFDLNIMQPDQDLYDISSRILMGLRSVIKEVTPSYVFVHGDTTTSSMAALASFYQQIPVAHIEAGLRTQNIYSPWPEEMNRRITGQLATFHFVPTKKSKENLIRENINEKNVIVSGNTVIDSLYWVTSRLKNDIKLRNDSLKCIFDAGYNFNKDESTQKIILITGHRRENFGVGLLNICNAIKNLSKKFPFFDFVYPVHLNPNVQKTVLSILGDSTELSNVFLVSPLDYIPFVFLMSKSYLILTDSGGIQEEAPSLGKPVLVMRDTTERPEAVESGTVRLVGSSQNEIEKNVTMLIENIELYKTMAQSTNPYGDGSSSKLIVDYFLNPIK
jgi:UDP-N-acetylglucosamine 2-epimerase (non-hydrolysing)